MAESSGMQRGLTPRRWGEVELEPRQPPETEEELLAREQETPPAEPAQEPPPAQTNESPPSTPFRFRSQEEAERAEQQAKQRMHEATTETAAERRRREELERELAELRQKLATPQTPPAPTRKPGETLKQYVARVRALDPDAEDYDERYAEVWEEGIRQFVGHDIEQVIEQRGTEVAQRIIEQRLKDYEQQQATQQRQKTDQERLFDDVIHIAKGMDLNIGPDGDPDVIDFFWNIAAKRADEQEWDQSAGMRDKIAFAVERTKRFVGTPPAAPVTPETTPTNGASGQSVPPDVRRPVPPMGRQTSSAPSGVGDSQEPVQPRSLGTIIEEQQRRRRV